MPHSQMLSVELTRAFSEGVFFVFVSGGISMTAFLFGAERKWPVLVSMPVIGPLCFYMLSLGLFPRSIKTVKSDNREVKWAIRMWRLCKGFLDFFVV